jgi:hypothetical protein
MIRSRRIKWVMQWETCIQKFACRWGRTLKLIKMNLKEIGMYRVVQNILTKFKISFLRIE